MRIKNLTIIGLSAMLIVALSDCSSASKFYTPTEANVSSKATLTELNQGRAYLLDRCSQCHRVPAPGKYTADEWTPVLNKMQAIATEKGVSITNEQKELIYKYLVSAK